MPSKGFTPSPETRAKISAALKARMLVKFPLENRRVTGGKRGRPRLSPEEKEKSLIVRAERSRIRHKNKWYKAEKAIKGG